MGRFDGKIVLVTGAARGIGRGTALCFAREGANVVINDVAHLDEAEALAAEIRAMGQQAFVRQADVSKREEVAALFAAAVEQFGRLDVAIANAGISRRESVVAAQWENVRYTLEVTQFGVFHTCQMAAQQMVSQPLNGRTRGKIVIIGSLHQEVAVVNSAAYNMAKAAVNHLGRTMAAELAAHKINVNIINPGWIDTPGERQHATEDEIQAGGKRIPWGRLGLPEDIGQAAVFLASDEADYITGADLRVDGGYKLGLRL